MNEEKQQPPPYIFTPQPAGRPPPVATQGGIVTSNTARVQGVVEICVRVAVIVFAIAIGITAAITLHQITELDNDLEENIDRSDELHESNSEVPDTPNLVKRSRGEGGFLLFLAVVLVICEIVMILIRCFYFIISTKYIIVFHAVDVAVCILLVLLLFGAAIAAVVNANEWDEWVDFLDDYSHHDVIDEEVDTMKGIRDALLAACGFCFTELFTIGAHITLLIFAFVFKWAVPPRELQ